MMYLSEVSKALIGQETISFVLPNGNAVPAHFHVTEVGLNAKTFIDCGGTVRSEERVVFQLWEANDYNHRLHPEKLIQIIELSKKTLLLPNELVEVEYQGQTIGRYGLKFVDGVFYLENLHTACLANDACGVPAPVSAAPVTNACTPGGGCC